MGQLLNGSLRLERSSIDWGQSWFINSIDGEDISSSSSSDEEVEVQNNKSEATTIVGGRERLKPKSPNSQMWISSFLLTLAKSHSYLSFSLPPFSNMCQFPLHALKSRARDNH
jgi:hypothetical protein